MKYAVLLCFLLAGCGSGMGQTETVYLSKAGNTVTCGPYPDLFESQQRAATASLRNCVSDFQRQGYERIPAPKPRS